MDETRNLRVFLCHSSNDKPAVRELYRRLNAEGWMDVWLDEEKLYPGQDWNMEIEKAVEVADAILVCLSNNSINKEGYVQRELRIVLDYADYKPEGTLYLIPIRLEDCKPPRRLRSWQYADYFEEDRDRSFERLLVSLRRRAKSLEISLEKPNERPATKQKMETPAEKPKQERAKSGSKTIESANIHTHRYAPDGIAVYFFGGIEFVEVPAGKFLMGSSDQDIYASDDEKPQHTVDLPYAYYMGRFPVTNGHYSEYVRAKWIEHPVTGWEKKQDHPVTNISWEDAMKYCDWLNDSLKSELPDGLVLRLPTETEWEKAARGEKGLIYPWGDVFDRNKCNVDEGITTPVGYYSPRGDSPYGCADMSGNVWEWTNSVYKDYSYGHPSDGREDENAPGDVLRGGSFSSNQGNVRCASRYGFTKIFPHLNGFRVCASPIFS